MRRLTNDGNCCLQKRTSLFFTHLAFNKVFFWRLEIERTRKSFSHGSILSNLNYMFSKSAWYYRRCTFINLHLHRPPRTMQLVQNHLTMQESDLDRFEKSGCWRTNLIVRTHLTKNESKISKSSILKKKTVFKYKMM